MALTQCKECGEEISTKATQCPKCGAPAKKKTSLFAGVVIVAVVLLSIGYFSDNSGVLEQSPQKMAMKNVKLNFSVNRGILGATMEANFTIVNNSQYPIKDVEITCTHYAKSGTEIDSNKRTIYDIVPAKGKKTFNKFKMGFIRKQVKTTSCVITDLEVWP